MSFLSGPGSGLSSTSVGDPPGSSISDMRQRSGIQRACGVSPIRCAAIRYRPGRSPAESEVRLRIGVGDLRGVQRIGGEQHNREVRRFERPGSECSSNRTGGRDLHRNRARRRSLREVDGRQPKR